MKIIEVYQTMSYLERQMNLPPNVKLVAVQEQPNNLLVFRLAIEGDVQLPANYSIPSLFELGDFFLHPEKYQRNST